MKEVRTLTIQVHYTQGDSEWDKRVDCVVIDGNASTHSDAVLKLLQCRQPSDATKPPRQYISVQTSKVLTALNNVAVVERLAKALRSAWSKYAYDTLGDKAPAGYIKPWDETGEWGRNGNVVVAKEAVSFFNQLINEAVTRSSDADSN